MESDSHLWDSRILPLLKVILAQWSHTRINIRNLSRTFTKDPKYWESRATSPELFTCASNTVMIARRSPVFIYTILPETTWLLSTKQGRGYRYVIYSWLNVLAIITLYIPSWYSNCQRIYLYLNKERTCLRII